MNKLRLIAILSIVLPLQRPIFTALLTEICGNISSRVEVSNAVNMGRKEV